MEEKEYTLTPEEGAAMAEYSQAAQVIQQRVIAARGALWAEEQAAARLQEQAQTALRMILKVHSLQGDWRMEGNRLVKA